MTPPGLKLITESITNVAEMVLITNAKSCMASIPVRSWSGRASYIRYGWDYDRDEWLGEIPEWLHFYCPSGVDSVTINYYLPGSGIHKHVDSLRFGDPIVVLSLGGVAVLTFYKEGQEMDVTIPPRSLMVMSGESRYEWEHGIKPEKSTQERWSIVFRKRISHTQT